MNRTEAEEVWLRTVGMRVRLARVARRESQEVLAARAGVTRVTLGSIERADHPASLLTYARLSRVIEVPLAELLDGAP